MTRDIATWVHVSFIRLGFLTPVWPDRPTTDSNTIQYKQTILTIVFNRYNSLNAFITFYWTHLSMIVFNKYNNLNAFIRFYWTFLSIASQTVLHGRRNFVYLDHVYYEKRYSQYECYRWRVNGLNEKLTILDLMLGSWSVFPYIPHCHQIFSSEFLKNHHQTNLMAL